LARVAYDRHPIELEELAKKAQNLVREHRESMNEKELKLNPNVIPI
jgi:hypothetical protein